MSQNVKDPLPHYRFIEPNPWAVFLFGGFACFLVFMIMAALLLLAGGAG